MVFKNKNKSSFIKYVILVIIQMFVSGLCVTYFAKLFSKISEVLIKVVVDIIIFIVNFVIQREFIFIGAKHEKK